MLNEGKYTAEFLLSEGNGFISRDTAVLAATATDIAPGTVMGVVTATGHWAPYSNAASDGTQTAKGVLYAKAKADTGTQEAVVIARNAEVKGVELTGVDAAAVVDLAAVGVIVRGPLAPAVP